MIYVMPIKLQQRESSRMSKYCTVEIHIVNVILGAIDI